MSETNDPKPTEADAANEAQELSEEALEQVSGGRRIQPPSRKDIEIEGDTRFDPRAVTRPTNIINL